jgi:hypothetical protein
MMWRIMEVSALGSDLEYAPKLDPPALSGCPSSRMPLFAGVSVGFMLQYREHHG